MFEALIREVAERFGIGDKAEALLAELLALIFNQRSGGVASLLARFRQQGFGDLFASWLGNPQPRPLEPQQLDNVLGASVLSRIADRLGIARGAAVAAASAMLPKLIGLLTQNGKLPTSIPHDVSDYLRGLSHLTGTVEGGMRETATAGGDSTSGLGWIKWILLAAILLALGYCMLNRKPEMTTTTPAGQNAAPTAAPVTELNPKPGLMNDGGKLSYFGQLDSKADKARFVDALNPAFGASNV